MACIQNIGLSTKVYNNRLCKRMKNEEMAHLEAPTEKSWKMLKIIWIRWLAYLSNSCKSSMGKGHPIIS